MACNIDLCNMTLHALFSWQARQTTSNQADINYQIQLKPISDKELTSDQIQTNPNVTSDMYSMQSGYLSDKESTETDPISKQSELSMTASNERTVYFAAPPRPPKPTAPPIPAKPLSSPDFEPPNVPPRTPLPPLPPKPPGSQPSFMFNLPSRSQSLSDSGSFMSDQEEAIPPKLPLK